MPSLKKRFWTEASVRAEPDGYAVYLDQHRLATPGKAPLILPTSALADAIAAEWQAQTQKVDPETMPMTRRANASIDKVAPQRREVADMLAEYGNSDLICYRAEHPTELAARQAEIWDPLVLWARDALGVDLITATGIIHVPQEGATLSRLSEMVHGFDPFALAALHDLVAISGSLIIAFAVIRAYDDPADLWRVSRVDEDWQAALWGKDDEAESAAAAKRQEFLDAFTFFTLVQAA